MPHDSCNAREFQRENAGKNITLSNVPIPLFHLRSKNHIYNSKLYSGVNY